MRQGNDNGVFRSEDGKIIGINLGADFCAEHEWGIGGIRGLAHMNDNGIGIERRRIHITKTNKEHLHLFKRTVKGIKETCLCFNSFYKDKDFDIKKALDHYAEPYWNKDEIKTYWDESGFFIRMRGAEQEFISGLYQAISDNDGCIFFGGGAIAFQNAGLCVARVSMIPQEFIDKLYQSDMDANKLKKAVEATGIKEILAKAGCNYFALSPSWKDGKVGGDITFWLNPQEQDKNNYGWMSIKDLKEWAKGKGKIPKEASHASN